MKIFNAEQIRRWDQYTIQHEPVSSIDLMERAATACVEWISKNYPTGSIAIFCGKGNNGGDGLAIARLLSERPVVVYVLEAGHKGTEDFQVNLSRLSQYPVDVRFINADEDQNELVFPDLVIDALFGSGLNRALEGSTARLVQRINDSAKNTLSIDIPSGMFTDHSSAGNAIIKAKHTLSFQVYKPALLVAENAAYTGKVHILDIGLHKDYYDQETSSSALTDDKIVRGIYKPRNQFAHKGTFGHAMLIAGSFGKIGAAVLSGSACLRSGAGLVSCHLPRCGYEIMQTSLPEVMVSADVNHSMNTTLEAELSSYKALGIGPGLGTASETRSLLREIFSQYRLPIVLDADALNCIAKEPDMLQLIPPGSVLTPHPKEFQLLFGDTANEFDRIELAVAKATTLNVVIILKGHHTVIALPDGRRFFNSTGNAGMATGGSGDVLTGLLTGLLAQGYNSSDASVFGVYLHGLAGDLAAVELSMEALVAGDIVAYVGKAYLSVAGG